MRVAEVRQLDRSIHAEANTISTDAIINRIRTACAPEVAAKQWPVLTGFPVSTRDVLRLALERAFAEGAQGLVVALSHDHYLTISGGVQNCVGVEEVGFRDKNWCFLHLCPNHPLPILSDETNTETFRVLATLNGSTLGVVAIADVMAVIHEASPPVFERWVVIHHLLGFSPEVVSAFIAATEATQLYFWTHDLFVHCPSIHLLRNDASFCGGPPIGSPACSICHAGATRATHVAALQQFFALTRPILLSPSRTILDFWQKLAPFDFANAHVIPPCTYDKASTAARQAEGAPLTVAFLGSSVFHKGWDVFEALAKWFYKDPRYRFFRLGYLEADVVGVEQKPVVVTPDDRMAMARAVREWRIDVVVNWSRCYESFSFTTIEALAGGAFVAARQGAGNVFPLVASIDATRGVAVGTVIELQAMFATGEIIQLARASPRDTGTLTMGIGAAGFVLAPEA